jgi:threonine dehydratase
MMLNKGTSAGSARITLDPARTMEAMLTIPELEPAAIRAAHAAIDPVFRDSPQYVHEGLSARLGVPVIVKVETANPIRSFKGRGTWVAVAALVAEGAIGPDRSVVCASAGNFGQGVAYAARSFGVPTLVFASRRANRAKVARMRALGAEVIEIGEDFDDARTAAERHAAGHDAHLLVDGDDPRISTGAATLALEITAAVDGSVLPSPAIVSVPVGNGALINGVGAWMRAASPACRVVGVQAEGAAAMTLSWREGRPVDVETVATYADGIASRIAVPAAVELMAGRVDDMRIVSDDALRSAQEELTSQLGITVEGAAAASWAGVLAGPRPDGPAILIVTGSNV